MAFGPSAKFQGSNLAHLAPKGAEAGSSPGATSKGGGMTPSSGLWPKTDPPLALSAAATAGLTARAGGRSGSTIRSVSRSDFSSPYSSFSSSAAAAGLHTLATSAAAGLCILATAAGLRLGAPATALPVAATAAARRTNSRCSSEPAWASSTKCPSGTHLLQRRRSERA